MPRWGVMIVQGIVAIGFIVLVLAAVGKLPGQPTWNDIADTCIEDYDRPTCACMVDALEEAGYEPEDFAGEDYDESAMRASIRCFL